MKVELTVPTSLNDIPLYQYQKFIKTFESEDELTDEYAGLKMLELFCGLKIDEALKIKMSDMNIIIDKLNKCLSEKPPLITRFKLGNTEFGFQPQLDDLTFGAFVDLENSISDWDSMHKAMAVLYRPVTQQLKGKYEIEEYRGDSWHDAMRNMPASVAVSAITFFFLLESDLMKATLPYSRGQEEVAQQEKQTSQISGDGITAL
tara:strand:- start:1223 stop:1834 length:612 start_codon:yes stop_codon:yes gene_type:complete